MTEYRFSLFAVVVFTAASLLTIGCDTGGTAIQDDQMGQIRVLLTDAPADSMQQAMVTIERIELVDSTDAVMVISEDTTEFDLLELQNGVTAAVADTLVPAGVYTQIRVIVNNEADILWDNGSTSKLKVPSGSQTGIKILLGELEIVEEGDFALVTLDFDANESFVVAGASGMVIFKPTIRVEDLELNGNDVEIEQEDEEEGEPSLNNS